MKLRKLPNLTPKDLDKFWANVNPATPYDGCWLWMGRCNANAGRATTTLQNTNWIASRIMYKIVTGTDPGDLHVLHKCDNPRCVCPEHLFLGTDLQNREDCMRKQRHNIGLRNANAKLNPDKVRKIRSKYQAGHKLTDLSAEFGVHTMTIKQVIERVTWAHVVD